MVTIVRAVRGRRFEGGALSWNASRSAARRAVASLGAR